MVKEVTVPQEGMDELSETGTERISGVTGEAPATILLAEFIY